MDKYLRITVDIITHPCLKFNGGLINSLSGLVTTPHWILLWLLTHDIYLVNLQTIVKRILWAHDLCRQGGGVIFSGSHITPGPLFALRIEKMAPPLIFNSNDNDKQNAPWDDSVRIFDWFVSITNISFSVINFRGKFLSHWNSYQTYHASSYRKMPTSLAHICLFVFSCISRQFAYNVLRWYHVHDQIIMLVASDPMSIWHQVIRNINDDEDWHTFIKIVPL